MARVQCLCTSTGPLTLHPALYMCQRRYDKNIKATQISATNSAKEREKKEKIPPLKLPAAHLNLRIHQRQHNTTNFIVRDYNACVHLMLKTLALSEIVVGFKDILFSEREKQMTKLMPHFWFLNSFKMNNNTTTSKSLLKQNFPGQGNKGLIFLVLLHLT